MGNVWLVNRATGEREPFDETDLPSVLGSGKYVQPDAVAVHRYGDDTYAAPDVYEHNQATMPAIDPARAALATGHQIRKDRNTGIGATLKAAAGGAIDTASFGLVDPWREAQEFNSGAATAGSVAGAIAPLFFGDGAGLASLANDGVATERAASSMSSRMLYAGEAGGEAGSAAKLAEKAIVRSGAAVDEASAAGHELAGLDAKGLRSAKAAELARIESERVPLRAQLADDIAAHREDGKQSKIWLATKDAEEREVREIGKISIEADKAIDRMLRNPKALASRPQRALDGLQQQEHALESLIERGPKLREAFAADTSGARVAALDAAPGALERNRALQARIGELTASPVSEHLNAIGDAVAALGTPKQKGLIDQLLGGSVFGAVTHAVGAHVPIIGPFLGAKAAHLAEGLVSGRIGKAIAEGADRTSVAIKAFLDTAKARAPRLVAPVLASKVLDRVRYASDAAEVEKKTLPALYHARSSEIRSQTAYNAMGVPEMRPDARAAMANRLKAIRAVAPMTADRMETINARRIEFLASKLPRRPDLGALSMGPDRWQPSDLEMRAFARYVAAAEDPHGVIERLAAGTITPEDAETLRAVYPELHAQVIREIAAELPTLRHTLPYERRLGFSIFSGLPVDAAMNPAIVAVLQSQFTEEPGSEGGNQAPVAQPQFGSVQKSIPRATPAQERAQGG